MCDGRQLHKRSQRPLALGMLGNDSETWRSTTKELLMATAHPLACDLPLDAYAQFRREVAALVPLAPAEEATLWACAAADQCARDRLVAGYQPLVLALAHRLEQRCRVLEVLDLAQEGTLGLLHALSACDRRVAEMPVRTWAACWIRSAMLQAIYRNERALRLPDRTRKCLRRLVRAQVELLAVLGREATTDELAQRLDVPTRAITDLLLLQAERFVSLDTPANDDPARFLVTDTRVPAETESQETPQTSRLHEWVRTLVEQLPERERAVITFRYGFDGDAAHSTRAVASLLGLTQAAVQDIDRRVRLRIRVALGRLGLPPDGWSLAA
jgi:RNA polymerase sigma factor (sigma-70 family)